ncbi:hypothetical protein B9Z55_028061 [Caenorhabditis nigoni]|uniref:Uncharacterized protein n=1 Tax=Caenorhabditis nigoni TaxID=1611254 RepID=A0A2G5SD79_9PELO|nr:hypothetical protein B9Z55_028061 [Caenorhabditis nigoni]
MSDNEDENIDPAFDPLNPTWPPLFDRTDRSPFSPLRPAQYLENEPEFGYVPVFDEDDEEEEEEEEEEDEEDDEGEYFLLDGNDESNDEEDVRAENREIRQEIEEQFNFFRNLANRIGQNNEPREEVHRDGAVMNGMERNIANIEGPVGMESDEDNDLLDLEPIRNQERNENAEIGNVGRNHDWPLEVLARVFRVELNVLEMALEFEAVVENFEAVDLEDDEF